MCNVFLNHVGYTKCRELSFREEFTKKNTKIITTVKEVAFTGVY